MLFTSNVLGALARALRLSSPSTYENQVTVQPNVVGTVSLREVMDQAAAGGAGIANSSFSTLLTQQLTNTTLNTTAYQTIKQGLWEFRWRGWYGHSGGGIVGDYNAGFKLYLADPASGGNPTIYLDIGDTNGISLTQRLYGNMVIALPQDMALTTVIGATA